MKLKYYIGLNEQKIYTLKKKINNQETKPAHYKFIRKSRGQDPSSFEKQKRL